MIYIAFSPKYSFELPAGHRFPIKKYTSIPEQLLAEGTYSQENFFEPVLEDYDMIEAVHCSDYIHKLKNDLLTKTELRRIGFPFNKELLEREEMICAGTTKAALLSMEHGVGFNVAGGTHHAHRNFGEGYCIYNDIAVAARYLLDHNKAKQILVVDLDVHQGNGTASIFADESRVFTFSIHAGNNFPLRKEKSDLDIPLELNIGDDEYFKILKDNLPPLIEKLKPDFIFFQSGVDIILSDILGRLKVSIQGCKERDRFVFETAIKHGIPVTASMGGGYSENLDDIVEAHCNTYRIAKELYN